MTIILNDEQRKIVEYRGDKFLSVQAGPGSGKTRVVVEKVKYMVKELKIKPESFLIITFSTKAADELKDRLIEGEIPASDVQKMQISTIHAFCLKILEETGTVGLDVVSEGDKLNLFIKKHLKDLGFEKESYIRTYEIDTIIGKYDEYSTFNVDTEKLVKHIEDNFPIADEFIEFVNNYMDENDGEFPVDELKDKKSENYELFKESYANAKYLQIAKSYPLYLELLEKENAIDYNQMQIRALEVMNNGYMPPYTNVLIDEFQDTDPVQMEIFKKFIENPKTESFTVVGDINQSIYGFRGSNKNYFRELLHLYPDNFEEVFLPTNYRSTEEIIDLSQDFIKAHYTDGDKLIPAKCGSKKHNEVYFMVSDDKKDEAKNLLEVIKYVDSDERMNLSDIGILMRSVKSSSSCFKTLVELLEENNINYQVRGTGDLKDSEELKYILTLMYHLIQDEDPYYTFVPAETSDWLNLKTMTGANKNKTLFDLSEDTKEILNNLQDEFEKSVIDMDKIVCLENEGWGNGIKKFKGIFTKLKKRQDEVFSRVKKPILSDENLPKYGITNENDLEFFHKLNDLKRRVSAESYYDRPTISEVYFELLCDITGYLTEDLVNSQEEIVYDLSAIIPSMSVYGEVMYDRSLRGAFWFIKRTIKKLDAYKPDEDAVQIMTVHASKGLEFPVVILASLRDNGFPLEFREHDTQSVTYTPDEFLAYPRYEDGDAKKSHVQEEERVIYVAKTRAEDELILSSIVKDSKESVEKALNKNTPENIQAVNKAPKRINDVINDNLTYSRLINPTDIDINILDPKHGSVDEEVVNLSFTALENYNECPFKYKLINEMGFTFTTKKEIDDGIFIHSALEIINKKIKANNNEYVGDKEVAKTVEILFEKANLKFKEEQLEKYDKKLHTITKDVIRYYNEVGNGLTIIASEYPFYIRGDNYTFSGVADLIYEKDGKLGILDYKNTSLVSSQYLAKYRKQLHFYVMALRDENKEFEGHKIEEIQIYAIKYKKGSQLFSFDIDDDYIEDLKEELKITALKIKNDEFTSDCEDCSGCPYKKICKK